MTMPVKSIATIAAVGMLGVSSANADSATGRMLEFYGEAGEFYLTDSTETEVVNLNKERMVEVCAGGSRHATKLKVNYDGNQTMVRPDNCTVVEAKDVSIEPAGELKAGWDMRGTVRPLNE